MAGQLSVVRDQDEGGLLAAVQAQEEFEHVLPVG
jgi:hypothetical protein